MDSVTVSVVAKMQVKASSGYLCFVKNRWIFVVSCFLASKGTIGGTNGFSSGAVGANAGGGRLSGFSASIG